MKANQKSRSNKGVSPVIGTLLMMPIVTMVVSIMLLFANGLINKMESSKRAINFDLEGCEPTDFAFDIDDLVDKEFIIWEDYFESDHIQWDEIESMPDNYAVFSLTESDYYNGIQGLSLNKNGNGDNKFGIEKPFPWNPYGKVSAELRFTTDEYNENYKEFSILQICQGYEVNIGKIKLLIDYQNDAISLRYFGESGWDTVYFDLDTPQTTTSFHADPKCWHYMKLTVDYNPDGDGLEDPVYVSFRLDGTTYYFPEGTKLGNAYHMGDPDGIWPEALMARYIIKPSTNDEVESFVDDFKMKYYSEGKIGTSISFTPPASPPPSSNIEWPMFHYNLQRTGYKTGMGNINAASKIEKWVADLHSEVWSSPAIGDVDDDGDLEIVVGSSYISDNLDPFFDNPTVYCFNANDPTDVKWSFYIGDDACCSPTLYDADDDGDLEIYIASDNGFLYCIDHAGNKVWEHNTGSMTNSFESHPVVGDITGDGNIEVVVGVCKSNNNIICLDAVGDILSGTTTEIWAYSTGSWIISPPSLYDIDNDDDLDVFIGDMANEKLYCYDGDGSTELWSVDLGNWVYWSAPVVTDVDNDGDVEIIIGITDDNDPNPPTTGEILLIDHTGSIVWRYGNSPCRSTVAVADIVGDGNLEIIAGFIDDEIVCLDAIDSDGNNEGDVIWSTSGVLSKSAYASPIIGDIDSSNDGLEIVVGGNGASGVGTYCLDNSGDVLWFHPTDIVASSPALGDVDDDSFLELLISGKNSGEIYCLDNLVGAPTVLSTQPLNNAVYVPINQDVKVIFSETMDTSIVNRPSLTQTAGTSSVTYNFDRWETTNEADDTIVWTHDPWDGASMGFNEHIVDSTINWATDICSAYVNSDAHMDVIGINCFGTATVRWFENDGSENFIAHDIYDNAPDGPISLYPVDLDKDGDVDITTASPRSDEVMWFENIDGEGTFISHLVWFSAGDGDPDYVYPIDLDDDNDIDILSACMGSSQIKWHENDGSENFVTTTLANGVSGATWVEACDLNEDGHMDFITAGSYDDSISWFENDGSQIFTENIIDTVNGPRSVQIINIDQDGDIDLIVTCGGDHPIRWFENDGSQSFTQHFIFSNPGSVPPNSIKDVNPADFDNDGDIDLTASYFSHDQVIWLENDGSQSFTSHVVDNNADGVWSTNVGDINGDLGIDILSASVYDDKLRWYENTVVSSGDTITLQVSDYYDADGNIGIPNPYSWSFTTGSLSINNPPVADFTYNPLNPTNGDPVTFTDTSSDSDGTITNWNWNFGDGNTHTAQNPMNIYMNPGSYTVSLIVTDDGGETDSYSDTITVSPAGPFYSWSMFQKDPAHSGIQEGTGSILSPTMKWSHTVGEVTGAPISADIDNDGNMEIVVVNQDGDIYCLEGSDGSYNWDYSPGGSSIWSTPAVGDIDGGNMEIIAVSGNSGNHIVYCLDSTGSMMWSYDTGTTVKSSPVIEDIDDGDNKEIIISGLNGDIYCLNNLGGEKWIYHSGENMYSCSPAVADIINNADKEIIFGTDDGNMICLNSAGGLEWSNNYGSTQNFYSSPAIADIDGGSKEILIGSFDDHLYCIDNNGGLKWRYQTSGDVWSTPAIGDINGGGDIEVVVGSGDNNVYCVDNDGNLLWTKATTSCVHVSPIIANIDGGSDVEVLALDCNAELYCLRGSNGVSKWTYDAGNNAGMGFSVADADADGELEIITGSSSCSGSTDNEVHCIDS